MKINHVNQINRIGAYQAYQKNSETPKKEDKKVVQKDQIELSSEAQLQIQKEREAKIEGLKAQIANGTYAVDSEKIAEKLLASWKSGSKINE